MNLSGFLTESKVFCYVDLESAQYNWESVKPFLMCQKEYTDFAIIKVRTTETVKRLIH